VFSHLSFSSQPAVATTGCDTKGGNQNDNFIAARTAISDLNTHIYNTIDFSGSWGSTDVGFKDPSVLIDPITGNYDTRVAQSKSYIDSAQTAILNAQCFSSSHSYFGSTLQIACYNLEMDYLKAWSTAVIDIEALYRGTLSLNNYLSRLSPTYSYSWSKTRDVTVNMANAIKMRSKYVENTGVGKPCATPSFNIDLNPSVGGFDVIQQFYTTISEQFALIGAGSRLTLDQSFSALIGDGSLSRKAQAVSTVLDIRTAAQYLSGSATGYDTLVEPLWEKLVWYTRTGVAPTLSQPTSTTSGFTLSVSNFDAGYSYSVSANNGSASINGSGLITVSGLSSGQMASVQVTASKLGFAPLSASASGKALSGIKPTYGSVNANASGFTIQVNNYDASSTWTVTSSQGAASINGSGLITVTGLGDSQSSTVTVTTSKSGVPSDSSTVTSGSAGTVTQVVTNSVTIAGFSKDYVDRSVNTAVAEALAKKQKLDDEASARKKALENEALARQKIQEEEILAKLRLEAATASAELEAIKKAKEVQDSKDQALVLKLFANPKKVSAATIRKLTANQVSKIPPAAFIVMSKKALAAINWTQASNLTPSQVRAIAKR
jgi:hypothetical protein